MIEIMCISLTIVSYALAKSLQYIETIVLLSIFSLHMAIIYILMDAPDVAMTESAVGACLSTLILLLTKRKIDESEDFKKHKVKKALFLVSILFFILLIILNELPSYGLESKVHTHVSKMYEQRVEQDIGIPSLVAAILASYRGFDTLCETVVIFIACAAILHIKR